MKRIAIFLMLISGLAYASDVYVKPYTKSDGTYIQGHHRTSPDSNPYNNYSTRGNSNPYTGQSGTVSPEPTIRPSYAPRPQPNNQQGFRY